MRSPLSRIFASIPRRYTTTVGIRKEDPTRIWERRSPLTPEAVHQLVQLDVQVHVEHCDRRIFTDQQYINAGASVVDDLAAADVILGIKEPPPSTLLVSPSPSRNPRTYMMFSHTAKGQVYNMPLISSFLQGHPQKDSNVIDKSLPRVIDFELLTDRENGKRTVGFGWFAGVAGVLESLSAMAHSHLESGIASPFLYTPRPHTMRTLRDLRTSLHAIGQMIANDGTPHRLGPFVIGLTGNGKVAEGCLSMLSELPIVNINVEDLPVLLANPETDRTKVYLVHASPSDYFKSLNGGSYSREDYYANPQNYQSVFAEKVAPYLTLFLNGAGWAPSFPRLMTNEQLTVALANAQEIGGSRFTNIGDISCDPEGGLQFLTHSTTLSSPFDKYRPVTLPSHLPSVQMMSVDILPTSLPYDASVHFSNALMPYLKTFIGKRDSPEELDALNRATITSGGLFSKRHVSLQKGVDAWRASLSHKRTMSTYAGVLKPKRILMLGSGMVARPAVNKIAERKDIRLVIASNVLGELKRLTIDHDNVSYVVLDVGDHDAIATLIRDADVVISLLPARFHAAVAGLCIEHHKDMVTASYISPEMQALDERAKKNGVLLLNEIGLDPGIDHCSAISLIEKLKSEKKDIVSFVSLCGGLPAPSCENMGPLNYKFSWSPRGVLTAVLNNARYRLNHKIVEIPGSKLLQSITSKLSIPTKALENNTFEAIPNRDSVPYGGTYAIFSEHLRTLHRGTLRYRGFSAVMQEFKRLGLLEICGTVQPLATWPELLRASMTLQQSLNCPIPEDPALGERYLDEILSCAVNGVLPSIPRQPMTPLDLFSTLLAGILRYTEDESDMVVMHHEVIARLRGQGDEVYTSSLVVYGNGQDSAMALTVGLPVAFAALQVVDGKVAIRGVIGPGDVTIREPVLLGLSNMGFGMSEGVFRDNSTIEQQLY